MSLKLIIFLIFTHNLLTAIHFASAENIDVADIEHFCYPEQYQNTRKSCECNSISASPWGLRAVNVDCSYQYMKTSELSETLPLYIDTLDLSWNTLDRIPVFVSDTLRLLHLPHNNITSVSNKNFIKIPNLRELYLRWNSIQTIGLTAFESLSKLQILDLSHNNIQRLGVNLFSPLILLETLNLSWNRQLNQTNNTTIIITTTTTNTTNQTQNFYQNYGLTTKVKILKLDACNLETIVLAKDAELIELTLRGNHFTKIPENLPNGLRKLDMSENLFEALLYNDTQYLSNVYQFYMEDMPKLHAIEKDSFVPLKSLEKISFQNSRALTSFHEYAFGVNATSYPRLKTMILRGTRLRRFNSTLSPIFYKLIELDLNGMPLYCDCELIWVKQLPMETNGRCYKPSRLRGMLLTNARTPDFSCDTWPEWVYGVIILGLIILLSAGIYLIVMGLRPHRAVTLRSKIGSGSPYSRVTIEPNRQESNHY